MSDPNPSLDHPIWQSLRGAHTRFAVSKGEAARYEPDVAPFAALAENAGQGAWADLAALFDPNAEIVLVDAPPGVPASWQFVRQTNGVQLTGENLDVASDPDASVLGPDDVPEMLDLIERTKPGPFRKRTIELGNYLGLRVDGELVAMAGERLQPPGWTEISAVCTDERFRGRGLAGRLIRAVGHGIRERGDIPFLHASAQNTNAIRLYESMGFVLRRQRIFTAWKLPG